MVTIEGEIGEAKKEFLKTVFEEYTKVYVSSNIRVIPVESYIENKDIFCIFSLSVPLNFTGGGYENITRMIIDDVNLLKEGEFRTLKCDTIPDDGYIEFRNEEGKYIACRKKNVLMLFVDFESLTEEGIKLIFNKVEINIPTDEEITYSRLKRLLDKGVVKQAEDIEEQIVKQAKMMEKSLATYLSSVKIIKEKTKQLNGLSGILPDFELLEKNLSRLFSSPNVKTVTLTSEGIKLITNPIRLWKWNIGEFELDYSFELNVPVFKRINPPSKLSDVLFLVVPNVEREGLEEIRFSHPHVLTRGACYGNTRPVLECFWNDDYLTGLNFAIQYLKGYNGSDCYVKFEIVLAGLGYITDSKVIFEHGGIAKITNGTIYDWDGEEITPEILESWGCTGEVDSEEVIAEYIEQSKFRKKVKALAEGVEYTTLSYASSIGGGEDDNVFCDYCGEPYNIDDTYNVQGDHLCEPCYDEHAGYCNGCDESYYTRYLTYSDYHNCSYCESCYSDLHSSCEQCGESYANDDEGFAYREDAEQIMCLGCYEEWLEERRTAEQREAERAEETPEQVVITPEYRLEGDGRLVPIEGAEEESSPEETEEQISPVNGEEEEE